MIDHKRFKLPIVGTAPKGSLEKGPANLYLVSFRSQIAVSRAADNLAGVRFNNREGALRFHRSIKVSLEDLGLVPVAFRMLYPNERIARRREEGIKIVRRKRTQPDAPAN